ncbi:hypothetical protein P170DRAFT_480396 [Aspergillus steynii IBT 23096]|uniref:Uncharacterized protein n=1 Tax=Aspergillus steynii IBT 23096 TaxID=1392250 RepID=A0A2I2FVP8_9EURO|nr:uncharacterized protein P170DRAFT_480396 [Aspergillus steynii IBT 23096]PLB44646.1 hypothetical protein P170DRAFT_480396 [Aspergillus steynii IBT 23096]
MPNPRLLNWGPLANVNPRGIDRKDKGLGQICACYDFGGGVGLGDSFAIHSIAAFSSGRKLRQDGSLGDAELAEAATAVTQLLPVWINLEDVAPGQFSSLPHPTHDPAMPGKTHPLDHPPWFLVNAAASRNHCILGQDCAVESLLMVLRQPWCVLEICCCDTQTVTRVSKFAIIAEKIYPGNYTIAIKLFSHELETRIVDRTRTLDCNINCLDDRLDDWMVPHPTLAMVRTLYTDLFFHGRHSRNPFWLCLMVVCAVSLNLAFSDLAGYLFDDANYRSTLQCLEKTTLLALPPELRKTNSVSEDKFLRMQASKKSPFWRTRPRRSTSDISLYNSAGRQEALNRSDSRHGPLSYHRLILLHRVILKRLQESIA